MHKYTHQVETKESIPMWKEREEEVRHLVLGRYEIGRLLGMGTFSKVHYGRDLRTGESVAIKIINKDQVKRVTGMMEQIQREISIMRLVRHPNVVELKEVMATKTRIFFVMEYVRGGELFAKVSNGRLPEDLARHYFKQLISAIDFCHSRGVSHRDLKPENLLLDENGNLKVSDFGLSALPEQLRHDGLLHTQCGTPAYVAPEVLRNKGYDGARTDLWSCGVILFVLLTGHLPFQHENMMKMYQKIFKAQFQVPPWVSGEARRLIAKLLVVDPANRISIPDMLRHPWLKNGASVLMPSPGPLNLQAQAKEETKQEEEQGNNIEGLSPRSYNAFELISSMSSGFDLSSLFENQRRAPTVFTSKEPARNIINSLERVAKALGFGIERGKKEGYKVRMEGKEDGRKGKLAVTAEVFEVAPEVAVVEFGKDAGDTLEYVKFCREDLRPGLKDIIWAWQGEDLTISGNELPCNRISA
ncbi:CBL-interacting serine/threonine-protein kinase 5 [Rhynchospora pubera]|uniref:non-specific serine/threonine protein kinase n=1 Tax=Rhynchospora pubera TaxID=906938 RepID=A0AAV8BUN1_9POAL|nr:CBL-interacting serine/threonine-protein kinase 5 [Rhynchospora pubera]